MIKNLEVLFGGVLTDEEKEGLPAPSRSQKSMTVSGNLSRAASGGKLNARSTITQASGAATLDLRTSSTFRDSSSKGLAATFPLRSSKQHFAEDAAVAESSAGSTQTLMEAGRSRRKIKLKNNLDMGNERYEDVLDLRKSASAPDFARENIDTLRSMSEENERLNHLMGKKRSKPIQTPFLEGREVHMYSGQKLNSAELQKDWLRKHMDKEQNGKTYTYCPAYNSSAFEFSGAESPGKKEHRARGPNDTYSRLPGDNRPVFRPIHPSTEDEYLTLHMRKGGMVNGRDVHPDKSQELREAFNENEWHRLPLGEERHKPLATHIRFEPDKVPHYRTSTEQPFDPTRVGPPSRAFGPKDYFESVYYHGRPEGEAIGADTLDATIKEQANMNKNLRGSRQLAIFNKGNTRHSITDLDRMEQTLKDPPTKKQGGKLYEPCVTIRLEEDWHEHGRPDAEWHARLRENDSTPPYDVMTGSHLPRDPNAGTLRGNMSGKLSKAPWRHGGDTKAEHDLYPCKQDFNITRGPPKQKGHESQVTKMACRTAIADHERSNLPYLRPHHYGQ
jgi:hypothetical protein